MRGRRGFPTVSKVAMSHRIWRAFVIRLFRWTRQAFGLIQRQACFERACTEFLQRFRLQAHILGEDMSQKGNIELLCLREVGTSAPTHSETQLPERPTFPILGSSKVGMQFNGSLVG